jgi:hypothetical protein
VELAGLNRRIKLVFVKPRGARVARTPS